MKTYMAKPEEVVKDWYVVDASDQVLGRLASQVAAVLRGKHKPTFTPHVDCGDNVIVVNCEKVVLTGNKLKQKKFHYHTGYVGGMKEIGYDKMMRETPERAVYIAVKGMLPKNSLGDKMLKHLRVYRGSEHQHIAQQPKELIIKD